MMNKKTDRKKIIEQAADIQDEKQLKKTLQQLQEILSETPDDEELLHVRAGLYEKLQMWSEAINDYLRIISLNKTDKEAVTRVEMLKTIMRYKNTDIYSSPNTNYDPWLE